MDTKKPQLRGFSANALAKGSGDVYSCNCLDHRSYYTFLISLCKYHPLLAKYVRRESWFTMTAWGINNTTRAQFQMKENSLVGLNLHTDDSYKHIKQLVIGIKFLGANLLAPNSNLKHIHKQANNRI